MPLELRSAPTNLNERDINVLGQQFVGVWRSVYEAREVLVLNGDGSSVTSYDGNDQPAEKWMVFAGNAPPPGLTESFDPTKHYIAFFPLEGRPRVPEIGDFGPNDFEWFYLGNGRRNAFSRVQ
ncbi:hypothetical protein U91I_03492 [alpha proteobacterium U9-1i]|nr:hypothetical protein U91I_03492 [alpha proteobacterium U9-1i]